MFNLLIAEGRSLKMLKWRSRPREGKRSRVVTLFGGHKDEILIIFVAETLWKKLPGLCCKRWNTETAGFG